MSVFRRRSPELHKAIITFVNENGPNGPYFAARRLSDNASITVSRRVWGAESWPPEKLRYVMLGKIGGTRQGLRADFARLWQEGDK